mgnify:CR=1 FL=1|tara:strand:+ start:487 stop:966 length:480 start_codon:yes stop_codon:yes gene_type:complete
MPVKYGLGFVFALVITAAGVTLWLPSQSGTDGQQQAGGPSIEITDAYLNLPPPGQSTTAAYIKISNRDQLAVSIIAFETSKAARVELHEHLHVDGMMKMRKIEALLLVGLQTTLFQPMGYHLMVFDLASDVVLGDMVNFTMTLASGERIPFQAQARSLQ